MTMLWRSWLTFATIIGVVLCSLSLLTYLQFCSILSDLIVHRLSVVAHTTSGSFRAVTDLGLPFEMVNNSGVILRSAKESDKNIKAIQAFDPNGRIIYSTDPLPKYSVAEEILRAQNNADLQEWGVETDENFYSGSSIFNDQGQLLGSVVLVYPKTEFNQKKERLGKFLSAAALATFAVFAIISYLLLKIRLGSALRGMKHLEERFWHLTRKQPEAPPSRSKRERAKNEFGLFGRTIGDLLVQLQHADDNYCRAKRGLTGGGATAEIAAHAADNELTAGLAEAKERERDLAESLARKLTPLAAILVILAVFVLGTLSLRFIGTAIEPEIVNRTRLIGDIVNANIQRAVSAGIPIARIVGAEQYLDNLRHDFREVSYIGIVADDVTIESGTKNKASFTPVASAKDELSYSLDDNGAIIGKVIIDVDAKFIARQFNEVNLDLVVVIMVALMITFESMVVMMGRTITTPILKVHTLASLQAAGDFSKYAITRGKDGFDRILHVLSKRAVELHEILRSTTVSGSRAGGDLARAARVAQVQRQFHLLDDKPAQLAFSTLNDIRWPLFLFVAADELPLSFFPLFTRAAENPWTWLDQGIVISLPLLGYLLAIFTSSPVARLLTSMLGHRTLLFLAMVPAVFIDVGLFFSTTVPEIVIYRTLSGFGYAIATLTYQDYVLDMIPKDQRTKSLGNYTAVLVGAIFCGAAIGGILADRLGQNAVFLISAGLVIISAILVLSFVPRQSGPERQRGKIEVKPAAIVRALANRPFFSLAFGIAVPCNIIMQAFIAYIVALYMNELGASTTETGRTLMGYFLMIYFVGPASTRLSEKKLSPAIVTAAGAVIAGSSLLLAGLLATKQALLLAVLGVGLGHGLVRSHQLLVVMQIGESSLAGLGLNVVLGTMRTVERGGSILGLLAIAWISGLTGYPGAIGVVGMVTLIGVALFCLGNLLQR